MATKKPMGWVFRSEQGKEVGFASPDECMDAEDALRTFAREWGDHFDVFFRDADGVMHSTSAESRPNDFLTASEMEDL